MQNRVAKIDRRHFCNLVLNVVLAKLLTTKTQWLGMGVNGPRFLIVNGWVLTSDDVAANKLTRNVVGL